MVQSGYKWSNVTAFSIRVAHVVCGPLTVIMWMSCSWVDSNILTPVHLKWTVSSSLLASSSLFTSHTSSVSVASNCLSASAFKWDFYICHTDSPSPLSPGSVDLFVSCSWFLCWHNSLPCTWQSSHWRYLWPLFTHTDVRNILNLAL